MPVPTTLATVRTSLRISDPKQIVISEISAANGRYHRAIRIYGNEADGTPPVLEILCDAADPGPITIHVPGSTF